MSLLPNHLRESEYIRTQWSVPVDEKTTLTEVVSPSFWAHVAKRLRQWDVIEVRPADATWFARLMVRSVGPAGPVLAVLEHHEFTDRKKPEAKAKPKAETASDYDVKFSGGSDKWRVVRKADKEVVAKGLETREAADEALEAHLSGAMA